MKKEFILHLFIAAISLGVFIYFDQLGISLNKIKAFFPSNKEDYLIHNTDEPYTFLINYENSTQLDSASAFSNSSFCTVDGGGNYSQGFSYVIKEIYPDSIRKVSLTAQVKRNSDTPFEFLFVISIDNKAGENVFWDAVYTNSIDFPINKWVQVNGERLIPASADDPENTIKIYPWNRGETTVSIDEFVLTIGQQKERKGNEVLLNLVENSQVIEESFARRYNSIPSVSKGMVKFTKDENAFSNIIYDKSNSTLSALDNNMGSVLSISVPWIKEKKEIHSIKFKQEQHPIIFNSKIFGMCISRLSDTKKSILIQRLDGSIEPVREIQAKQQSENILQQTVVNSSQNQSEIHVILYESGAIQLSSLELNGNETLIDKSLSQLCPGGVKSLISIVDPETQRNIGLACITSDRSNLYILQLEKNDFKVNKIKVDKGLDITDHSTLFSIKNSEYIIFNNEWRFELRKAIIQNGEITPQERIELVSTEKESAPKYYESHALTITKSNINEFIIVASCANKSGLTIENKSLKNKIEFFNIKL